MQGRYKNPPIKEAVCEFRFQSGDSWDLAVPGLVFAELRKEFPRRVANPVSTAGVTIGNAPPEVHSQIDEMIRQDVAQLQGLRFWRADSEDGLIVVGPNRLGISHYRPYPSWPKFLQIIEQAIQAYKAAANPTGFQRIGLRYINDIVFDRNPMDLEDYFEYYPFLGAKLPQDFGTFRMSLDFPYKEGQDRLRLQLSNEISAIAGQVTIRLDLDYGLLRPGAVELGNASEWLQFAHASIEEVFEGSLKDSARAIFDEERS